MYIAKADVEIVFDKVCSLLGEAAATFCRHWQRQCDLNLRGRVACSGRVITQESMLVGMRVQVE